MATVGEVKVPTARNILIGTRQADFTTHLIDSKRFGRFDTHANVGYTFVGKPAGANKKTFSTLCRRGKYFVRPKFTLLGEILANTGSSPEVGTVSTITNPIITPEVSSGELVEMLESRYRIREKVFFTLGLSYDNDHAVLFRPGLTFYFNRPGRTRTQ